MSVQRTSGRSSSVSTRQRSTAQKQQRNVPCEISPETGAWVSVPSCAMPRMLIRRVCAPRPPVPEGIAPCDAAAQPKQKTEHRIRGMNEQAEQTIRLLVFAADGGQREKAPAQRGGQAERQADGHQQERRTDMRDEGGSQRGARFADEGFVSGDIPCIRAGIEFALDRAAYGDARKTEERKRHQHGFDSGMNQREEEGARA